MSRYTILNKIKTLEKKHNSIKDIIVKKIDLLKKTEEEIKDYEKKLNNVEKEYVKLVEELSEINKNYD